MKTPEEKKVKIFEDPSHNIVTKLPNAEINLIDEWEIDEVEEYSRFYRQNRYVMRLTPVKNFSRIEIVFDNKKDIIEFKERLRIKEKSKIGIKKIISNIFRGKDEQIR